MRQTKTNFSPIDPFSVRCTFEEKKVSMEPFELEDTELVEEESIPVRERILSALRAGPATNAELQDVTGATVGTIRNNLSQLIQAELVTEDGGRPKTYRLVSSSTSTKGSDDDTNDEPLSYHVAPGESFTVEQLQRIRKLMRQGMSEKWAKKAVLADRHSVGCGCEVCR